MNLETVLGAFIIFPLGALLIGVIYLRLFFKSRRWSCFIAGLLWSLYSLYESLMYLRILCTGECNIRIDLLLIYPLLLALSVTASVQYYRKK
mgnify:CR=1 FL=1